MGLGKVLHLNLRRRKPYSLHGVLLLTSVVIGVADSRAAPPKVDEDVSMKTKKLTLRHQVT